jgi:nitrite reductase/ring-hydroxylating ferredoxin subunit
VNLSSVCRVSDLGDPGSLGFVLDTDAGPEEWFVVRRGDCIRAYRNSCPHTGAPLDWVPNQFLDPEGERIQCALHGALFRVETGECLHGPCPGSFLESLSVVVDEGEVLVATRNSGVTRG